MNTDPDRLRSARSVVTNPENELLLSAASSWEIALKYELGRLALPVPPHLYVPSRLDALATTPVSIEHAHTFQVAALPRVHRDPFDRLLVAQSQMLSVPLLSADEIFTQYDIDLIEVE